MAKKSAAVARVEPERRTEMIAEAAYYRAESRNFAPGSEMEDWLIAEREVERLLSGFVPEPVAARKSAGDEPAEAKKKSRRKSTAAKAGDANTSSKSAVTATGKKKTGKKQKK